MNTAIHYQIEQRRILLISIRCYMLFHGLMRITDTENGA